MYRIHSTKLNNKAYLSFKLADLVFLNLETNEMVKVNDYYGNYNAEFEIK